MSAALFAVAFVLAGGASRDEGFRVWKGASGPRVEVRVARPTLVWEIWPDQPSRKIREVLMSIDARPVSATYDSKRRAVVYSPPLPLSPGVHRVECRVTFENGVYVNEKWDTKVAPDALAELPAADPSQREALAAVNRLRERLRLEPMQGDDRLNYAARLHSEYLSINKTSGHHQDPRAKGYVGATSPMRLESCGYIGGSWEGVDFGSRTPTEAVRNLFDAPYHRLPFLQPGRVLLGSGFHDDRMTLEFSRSGDEGTVVSPADGETDVPARWRNFEKPNPLQEFPGAPREVGYPIVYVRFGRAPSPPDVTGTLAGPDGETVETYVTRAPESAALFLIPKRPLQSAKTYEATFTEPRNGRRVRTRFTVAGRS
ncbi:MAG: CAP domain-containing protein [Fimbriimonas sp.]